MPETDFDQALMDQALAEAVKGRPSPNPRVGALVARGKEVVATGFHERAGDDHAEVVAINRAGARAKGATLYVTLEPCNHDGRTPPCVDAILDAQIARVVIAVNDPNPHVQGGGAERLRQAAFASARPARSSAPGPSSSRPVFPTSR